MSFEDQNQTSKYPKKLNRTIVGYILVSAIVLVFGLGFIVGQIAGFKYDLKIIDSAKSQPGEVLNEEKIPEYLSQDVDFQQFWQTWDYIKSNYVKSDIADTQLFYGALAGLVASLGDPYSVFFNPEISQEFEQELSGSFEGIGAEIGIKHDQLTIIAPLKDTPAYRAGLKAGDKILAIDGYDTRGIATDYAVSIIRGKKGTSVTLTIMSENDEGPREVSIVRDTIEIDSVIATSKDSEGHNEGDQGFSMKDGRIAYIELRWFNENTLADWNKTIQAVLAQNPNGIILDLRNNPGGFLSTAIDIAGEWVDGKDVVLEKLRSGVTTAHHSNRQPRLVDIPTVVLVNGGSASGSEIVAGALQDYRVATIVGETTFGKGSVQDLKQFSDGSSVKLTIAEWLTPLGRSINEQGIAPDIEIELTKEDYDNDHDPQLAKALEILRSK
ncbi:MAG: S41 family peptidase [Patescibacteria group bacterium]|jgi:carboxyl-terminal processing protease|nr:S41 family peptidase [Patescibacteria group bacterium]